MKRTPAIIIGLTMVVVLLISLSGCFPGNGNIFDFDGDPIASIVASPNAGDAPVTVNFTGSEISGANHNISVWKWTFGDGASGFGESVTHTYTKPGNYIAVLKISTTDGEFNTTTQSIEVTGQAQNDSGCGECVNAYLWPSSGTTYGSGTIAYFQIRGGGGCSYYTSPCSSNSPFETMTCIPGFEYYDYPIRPYCQTCQFSWGATLNGSSIAIEVYGNWGQDALIRIPNCSSGKLRVWVSYIDQCGTSRTVANNTYSIY